MRNLYQSVMAMVLLGAAGIVGGIPMSAQAALNAVFTPTPIVVDGVAKTYTVVVMRENHH